MSLSFSLFGIPVRVHVWFVLVGMLLGMSHPDVDERPWFLAVWLGVVFFGVLSHELGHALVGRRFGYAPRIELVALGGVTSFEGIDRAKPWQRMLTVFAGPLVNGTLGTLFLVAHARFAGDISEVAAMTLREAGIIQIFWAVLNLIPMIPLDGGHILLEGCRWISPTRGPRVAGVLMLFVVVGMIVLGAVLQNPILLAVAIFAGIGAYRLARDGTLSRAEDGRSLREQAYFALAHRDGPGLVAIARKLVASADAPPALDEAFHLLAWGRLFSGEPAEAKQALASISGEHPATHALEGAIALELGDPDKALEQFEQILPRLNPWLEDYFVRAILASRRWDDARTLFEDELGREFSAPSLLAVMTAARADGAVEAAEAMRALLARKLPRRTPA